LNGGIINTNEKTFRDYCSGLVMVFKYIDKIISDTTDFVLSKNTNKFTEEEILLIDNLVISILGSYKNSELHASSHNKKILNNPGMIVAAITKDLWLDTSAAQKGNTGSITLWFYKFYSEQKDQSFAKYKTNLEPDSYNTRNSGVFSSNVVTGILMRTSDFNNLFFCDCKKNNYCDMHMHNEVHMRTKYTQNDLLDANSLDQIKNVHFENIKKAITKNFMF